MRSAAVDLPSDDLNHYRDPPSSPASTFLSGFSSFVDKYPILGSLHNEKSFTRAFRKPPLVKPNSSQRKETDVIQTEGIKDCSWNEDNMDRLRKLSLKRTMTPTDRRPQPLGTHSLSTSSTTKLAVPKRRAVSLDRRPSSRRSASSGSWSTDSKENDFTCPICLDILYRPRELSCGHLFCLICLQSYFNTCSKYFSCPSCRRVIRLPENGVSGLDRNPALERVANQLSERKRQMVRKAQICYRCHSDTDVKGCGHCNKGWCVICQPQHRKEVRNDLNQLKDRLLESRDRLLCKGEEQESRYNKLEEKIIEALELRKGELLLQVQDLRRLSQKRIKKLSIDLDNSILTLFQDDEHNKTPVEDRWREFQEVRRILTRGGAGLDQRITLDTTSLTLTNATPPPVVSPAASPAVSGPPSPVATKDSSFEDEPEDIEDEGISIPKDHGALYRKMSSYAKFRWTHSSCIRPGGVAVSPYSGLYYVTASDACKVHIFNAQGKEISSFGSRGPKEGCFLCPIGITFALHTNELYITDKWKHCIHVFDCEGRFLRQMGKKGKGLGEFSSPEGISTDQSGKIYVADTCNDRIQVLDKDGVYLREVGFVSSEVLGHGRLYTKREFNEPVGVAVSRDGSRIYVADSGNHRIRVFDGETGERVLVFGSRGRNRGQFESPESVAADDEGFIVVGDSGNGRVQIFRPNGRFVRVLGSRGGARGEFGWVSGVAVTKMGGVVVTDFKNNAVALF